MQIEQNSIDDSFTTALRDDLPHAAKVEEWLQPIPLPNNLHPVMPFDPFMLPPALTPWVTDISERMQAPTDYPVVALIIAAGSVIGNRAVIRPKRLDNWEVVPNLYGAIIGSPSQLKSPAMREGLLPVRQLEQQAWEAFQSVTNEHKADEMIREATYDDFRSRLKKAVKKESRDEIDRLRKAVITSEQNIETPILRRYTTSDPTVEKLGELIEENPQGLLVVRDELSGWLAQLERAGRESERSFYLEAWNGDSSFTFDRIGRGTKRLPRICISILGTIQPSKLSPYLKQTINGLGNDGLMQQFQLAVYPDEPKEWKLIDRKPDTDAKDRVFEVFKRLDTANHTIFGGESDENETVVFRYSGEAQEVFFEWLPKLEQKLRCQDEHPAIREHLAKYRSLVPSLSLIFHLLEVASEVVEPSQVSFDATCRAISWASYLETHARRIYGLAITADARVAQMLLSKIKSGKVQEPFSARDVYRNQWTMLRTADDVKPALALLESNDWIRRERVDGGMRYLINPKIKMLSV